VDNQLTLSFRPYVCYSLLFSIGKGKAGKYTQYSHVTGVTVDNQSTLQESSSSPSSSKTTTPTAMGASEMSTDTMAPLLSWSEFLTQVPLLISTIEEFANERQWTKFHTPRNLVLALLGEVGELAEIVQWKGDEEEEGREEEEESPIDSSCKSTTTTTMVSARFSLAERDHLSQEIADVSIYLLRLVSVTKTTEAFMSHLLPTTTAS
jgi:NTP pyrophosphatase (non-canonical NTP hydrolase)